VENELQLSSQSSLNSSDFSPSSRDDRRVLRRSASQHHNRYGDNGVRQNPEIHWKFDRSQTRLNGPDAGLAGAKILASLTHKWFSIFYPVSFPEC